MAKILDAEQTRGERSRTSRSIVVAPNPVLSQKAKPVAKVNDLLLSDMAKALDSAKDPIGVGLAAPQIGKPLRIFIVRTNPKAKLQTFINPVIEQRLTSNNSQLTKTLEVSSKKLGVGKDTLERKLEGCLSLPNIWGSVKRAEKIKLNFLDETGKSHTRTFKGFLSTIIQHEVDHLNGVLFPKRVLEQKGTLYKSRKDEKGEDVFDEITI